MTVRSEVGGTCPQCGAPYDVDQEYCLECGARLPASGALPPGVESAWRRRPRGPWLGPVLVGLLIAAAMTGIAILIARGTESDARSILIATGATGFSQPTTETLTTPETGATATETLPTAPATTKAEPTPPPRTLVEWPPSQSGYTVVIASLPASAGRAQALRKAREALRNGLPEVGVLDSGEFSSLHPGYYVVFSGIYENQRDAVRGAPRVQELYPAAYFRQISR
jgi:eukaryotic-like serine/threonine-protein kinase